MTLSPNTAWTPYPLGRVLTSARRAAIEAVDQRPRAGEICIPKPRPWDEHSYLAWHDLYLDWKYTPRKKPRPDVGAERRLAHSWFCIPEQRDVEFGGRRVTLGPYCGAPEGVRCTRCNVQLADHDPGDEDPRKP